jgi:putative transposase
VSGSTSWWIGCCRSSKTPMGHSWPMTLPSCASPTCPAMRTLARCEDAACHSDSSYRAWTSPFEPDTSGPRDRSADRPDRRRAGHLRPTLGNWVAPRTVSTAASMRGSTATTRPACASRRSTTPSCGWSVTSRKRTVGFWSRRHRHREPRPLCRCSEGRRIPVGRRLPRGRDLDLGVGYAWTARHAQAPSDAERQQAQLVAEIRVVHADLGGVDGSPRATTELRRRGWTVNRKRVARLMAGHGAGRLPAPPSAQPHQARHEHTADPDLLGRRFNPEQPDLVWCGDIPTPRSRPGRHLTWYQPVSERRSELAPSCPGRALAPT